MQRSKLDEFYSHSNTRTRKEVTDELSNYRQFSLSSRDSELLKYVDPFTAKVSDEFVIIRNKCPLCDSLNYSFLFIKHGFDHVHCNECKLIFTNQILDESKISYMEEGGEGDNYGNYKETSIVKERDRIKFEMVFDEIEKFSTIKNIFDFGSQVGTFLDWAKEKYSITGHEYHTPLRKIAQAKGHDVRKENLADIKFDSEFDLITNWDYIDHVLNPKETVANLTKYLKKGGLFFFAINNRDSLSVRIMHEHSPIFIGPHHTMHFGIEQLKILMKGYELIYSDSYVSELNWISNWLNFENPEYGDSKLMTQLFEPEKICSLGMGFKVNAIFKKL